jgi:hypothetical protein
MRGNPGGRRSERLATMQSDDPTKKVTGTPDSVRCNRDALRQSIDAAWSRLIHVGETPGNPGTPPADARTTGQGENPYALPDTIFLRSW